MIFTRAMRASSNTIPKKDRPPSPGEDGTGPEEQSAIGVEVVDQRAALSLLGPVRLVDVGEDRAEAGHSRPDVAPSGPGTKKKPSVIRLPTGVNRRGGAKSAEDAAVGRIVEEPGQPARGPTSAAEPA